MLSDASTLAERLYNLLPAVYRLRDAELQQKRADGTLITPLSSPLRDLIAVIAEQVAVVQEGLEQSYDDLFIETCAQWVIPYLGDLIGARPLHGKAAGVAGGRAEVAETLGLRRRKGTIAALEQIARVVTGYPAVAVEFFLHMALTQYFQNHLRPNSFYTVNMRDLVALERLNSAFDTASHTLDVRRISSGRGKYNIGNIGIYLYRIRSYALHGATASAVDDFRYVFNPLGINTPLYNDPLTETDITHFATPEDVPIPITRLALKRDLTPAAPPSTFYGPGLAILLNLDGTDIPESDIVACNLSDIAPGVWAHAPSNKYGIDPMLGRIALPTDLGAPPAGTQRTLLVNFRYGFSDDLGGGEYERTAREDEHFIAVPQVVSPTAPDVQPALTVVEDGGLVQFGTFTMPTNLTYTIASAAPNMTIHAAKAVEIYALNGGRPVLYVTDATPGAIPYLVIEGEAGATLALNGLAIIGGLRITGTPASVTLRHCTLVPGISRTGSNDPTQPDAPSLIIESDGVIVTVDHCIIGSIQAANGSEITIIHSIVDATDEERIAFSGGAGPGGSPPGTTLPGGSLRIENSTVIGRVHTQQILRASNVIFSALAPTGSALLPVRSERTQAGCVRFSVVPGGSRTPRRYRCISDIARFTSLRFGTVGYCQLSAACDESIRRGASDESEIGVFHDLYQPQRESDLRTRLDEYLRFGMEAGIFYAS